jgi:hypothetical protein
MMKEKVFGVGLHRTGTTSLRSAMPVLGYKTVPPWRWTGRYAHTLRREDVLADAFDLAAHHDASIYMPFTTFYRELHENWPTAKFILTERDEDAWVKSMVSFFGGGNWPEVRFAFGIDAKPENDETLRQVFRDHNRAVKEFFADKPGSLLVMDISKGDGWPALCRFLGESEPAAPFPLSNARASLYAKFVMNAIPLIATAREVMTAGDLDISARQREPEILPRNHIF